MTVEILRFPTDEDWLRCKTGTGYSRERYGYTSTDEWKEKNIKVRAQSH